MTEYTDPHHDNAGVPHTVILPPGLRIEKVYVGYWFWGRPSIYQLWADLQGDPPTRQAGLRPDDARGAGGVALSEPRRG